MFPILPRWKRSLSRPKPRCARASCAFWARRHEVFVEFMEKGMPLARRQFLEFAAAAFAIPRLSLRAFAQNYPARPVKVIVPVGPGGANDTSSRLIAQKLSE